MSNHNPKNMTLIKYIFAVFLAATVSFANADNYEGYTSRIEGVGLWWLETTSLDKDSKEKASYQWLTQAADRDGNLVIRSFRFGENSEFAFFCNGKNKVYIYEKAGTGYTCKTVAWGEQVGFEFIMHDISPSSMKKMRHIIELAKKDRNSDAGQSRYFVSLRDLKVESQRIFSVSKNKLVRGNWIVLAPTNEELKSLIKLAKLNLKSASRSKDTTHKSVLGFSNKAIGKLAERNKAEAYTLKLQAGETEVFLLPIQYNFDPLGGDLISSVFLREGDNYRFIGHVSGCLLSVGADLDADGIPEVILENCNSSEGQYISYVKLVPEIKTFVSYSHN